MRSGGFGFGRDSAVGCSPFVREGFEDADPESLFELEEDADPREVDPPVRSGPRPRRS
jgi:hypothetical protein